MLGVMQFFQKLVHQPLLECGQAGRVIRVDERVNAFFQNDVSFVVCCLLGHDSGSTPFSICLQVYSGCAEMKTVIFRHGME